MHLLSNIYSKTKNENEKTFGILTMLKSSTPNGKLCTNFTDVTLPSSSMTGLTFTYPVKPIFLIEFLIEIVYS